MSNDWYPARAARLSHHLRGRTQPLKIPVLRKMARSGTGNSAAIVVDLYAQGLSAREIATRVGYGRSTVLRRLHEAGISLRHTRDYGYKRRGKRIAPHRRDILDKNLIDLYKTGLSTTAIANQLGCDKSTVWRRLKKAGTELRPMGFDKQKFRTLQIVGLYVEGLTAGEVAAKLGCARSTVTRRLHQAGISRRSLRGQHERRSARSS